ncbi:hypothetical protein F5Y12DRAFT_710459 [Xylaria sp. FL1777]|nr:hypothetical protein F5Y12DRAFT_710459 [Xylaria sp. FL1777]
MASVQSVPVRSRSAQAHVFLLLTPARRDGKWEWRRTRGMETKNRTSHAVRVLGGTISLVSPPFTNCQRRWPHSKSPRQPTVTLGRHPVSLPPSLPPWPTTEETIRPPPHTESTRLTLLYPASMGILTQDTRPGAGSPAITSLGVPSDWGFVRGISVEPRPMWLAGAVPRPGSPRSYRLWDEDETVHLSLAVPSYPGVGIFSSAIRKPTNSVPGVLSVHYY